MAQENSDDDNDKASDGNDSDAEDIDEIEMEGIVMDAYWVPPEDTEEDQQDQEQMETSSPPLYCIEFQIQNGTYKEKRACFAKLMAESVLGTFS